jgi:hypothetical protein
VDGDIQIPACEEFEKHLQSCNPCQIVVDTIRRTITLYKGEEVHELPEEFSRKLHAALKKGWAHHPGGGRSWEGGGGPEAPLALAP